MIRSWIAVGAGIVGCLPGPAPAGTLHVPDDYASILSAVDAAAAGDSILIAPGRWTDKETRLVQMGSLLRPMTSCGFLKAGLTLIGEAGAEATIVDAGGTGDGDFVDTFLFVNQPSGGVELEGLTVTGAGPHAAAVYAAGTGLLEARSCRFTRNAPGRPGYAIRLEDGSDIFAEDCEISFNDVSRAVSVVGGSLEILRCRFEGNTGTALRGGGTGQYAIVQDCEFLWNRDPCVGGVGLGPEVNPFIVQGNLFLGNVATGPPLGCIQAGGLSTTLSSGSIRFNTFAFDSSSQSGGGISLFQCGPVEARGNTFYGCHATPPYFGSAVRITWTPSFTFDQNLVAASTGAAATEGSTSTMTSGSCNDFWANEGGNFDGWTPTPTDIFEDPLFCDPEALDLSLQQNSPCADGNTPGCSQIGAWGVGCGLVGVEPMTWSRVKARYR